MMLQREPGPHHQITAVSSNGLRARWGADEREAMRIPSGLTWSTSMPGGADTLRCTLPRDPDRAYPDLGLLTELQVSRDGGRTLRYRLDEAPKVSGDQMAVEPAARGYRAALEDRSDVKALFVDRDLGRWQAMSAALRIAQLTANIDMHDFTTAVDVSTGLPALVQTMTGPWGSTRSQVSWATYDAGDGMTVASVYYDFIAANNIADANFGWYVRVSDKDDHSGTNYTSSDLQAASGSGYYTPSLPLRFANLQHFWSSGGGGGSDGVNYEVQWRKLAVYGDHGLTKQGDSSPGSFYTGQMVGWIVDNFAPSLSRGTVEDGTFLNPHAAYRDPSTALSIIENLTRYEPLYDWYVYDDFNFQRRGTYGRKWRARVGPSGLRSAGQTTERLWNEIAVRVQDPLYGEVIVGPTDSGYSNTSDSLRDYDPENPANQAGITRRDLLDIGEGTIEGAIEVGRRFLEETKRLDNSGQCELTGFVEDDAGVAWPVDEVRAGDEIQFTDSADTSWRHISTTSYSADSHSNAISIDAPARTLSALLDRLQAVLIPLG